MGKFVFPGVLRVLEILTQDLVSVINGRSGGGRAAMAAEEAGPGQVTGAGPSLVTSLNQPECGGLFLIVCGRSHLLY